MMDIQFCSQYRMNTQIMSRFDILVGEQTSAHLVVTENSRQNNRQYRKKLKILGLFVRKLLTVSECKYKVFRGDHRVIYKDLIVREMKRVD